MFMQTWLKSKMQTKNQHFLLFFSLCSIQNTCFTLTQIKYLSLNLKDLCIWIAYEIYMHFGLQFKYKQTDQLNVMQINKQT